MARQRTIPEDLLIHFKKEIPGFKRETVRCQHALARMVWVGPDKHREHPKYEGAMSFGYKELDEWFGRDQFEVINERLAFFKVEKAWHHWVKGSVRTDPNHTKGYRFSERVQASWDKYLARPWQKKETRMMFIAGQNLKAQKTLTAAFSSTDSRGKAARISEAAKEAKELRHVPVHLDKLQQLRKHLIFIEGELQAGRKGDLVTKYPELEDIERLQELTSKFIRVAKTDVAGRGYIAQQYIEAQSGRWYASDNAVNLQNLPTLIKQAALADLWEYDFANCHFAVMEQMAARYGYQCEAITAYIANKDPTREAISEQVGISMEDTKKCLLAVMYGAKESLWHKNAIPEAIGEDAAGRLFRNDLFKGIMKDATKAAEVILKKWPRTANGSLTNDYGKAISGIVKKRKAIGGTEKKAVTKAVSKAQQLAHLTQGVEAKALMVVIEMCPHDLVLLQHDGFVSTKKLHPPDIEKAVLETTGYQLKLEEKRIQIDLDKEFGKQQNKKRVKRVSPRQSTLLSRTFAS